MKRIFSTIEKLSTVDTSVLIRGENGTGKELVARAIHTNSMRKGGQFVTINCGAIPENLMESEFFGHEKGAFTGADKRTIGKIQFATGGTLFLDEIGDMPLSMQVKLLRVIQERSFTPVGSNREIKSDIRILAATNKNLERMIEEGTFRDDLFYRLNVLPVFLPPLRERVEDIELLTAMFIDRLNSKHERDIEGVSPDALKLMRAYRWPGNIRELENVIELVFVLEESNLIQPESLPAYIKDIKVNEGTNANDLDYVHDKEKFEKEFIIRMLKKFGGKVNKTIEHTKIPKNTLHRKIKKYNINPKDYEKK
jgi:transcriptional regulator with PAS, ATPase and Fis domain